jgi:hypothetical protein
MQYIALVISAALTIVFAVLTLGLIFADDKNWLAICTCALTFYLWFNAFINTLLEKAEFQLKEY